MTTDDESTLDIVGAVVENPEAIGDLNQTPVVRLSPRAAAALSPGYAARELEMLAEELANEGEGKPLSWLPYDDQEKYRRIARRAIAFIRGGA